MMTIHDKKERLRRLSELNMKSLGVTSFSEPSSRNCGQSCSGVSRANLNELRDRIAYFYGRNERNPIPVLVRRYQHLY